MKNKWIVLIAGLILLPFLTGFFCSNSRLFGDNELIEYYEDLEKTEQADEMIDGEEDEESFDPSPTLAPSPTPTQDLGLPDGTSWEDLVGPFLPPPPSGSVHLLSTCEISSEIKVEGMDEAAYEAYKKSIRDAGWEDEPVTETFDPEKRDLAKFSKESDQLFLDYHKDTQILFMTLKTKPEQPDTLVIPGGKAWSDVIHESVPAFPQGIVIMNQEVKVGEGKTAARRLVIDQITEESLSEWFDALQDADWLLLDGEYEAEYEALAQELMGPSLKPAEEMANFYGAPASVFFGSNFNQMVIEIVYAEAIAVITLLMP